LVRGAKQEKRRTTKSETWGGGRLGGKRIPTKERCCGDLTAQKKECTKRSGSGGGSGAKEWVKKKKRRKRGLTNEATARIKGVGISLLKLGWQDFQGERGGAQPSAVQKKSKETKEEWGLDKKTSKTELGLKGT